MFTQLSDTILLPAMLLVGAVLVLFVYNFVLYLHHREKIILKYSIYLFTIMLYILVDLYSKANVGKPSTVDAGLIAHAINYIVILSYALFLMEVAFIGRRKFPLLFRAWDILTITTIVYIIYTLAMAFFDYPQKEKLTDLLANIFRIAFITLGIWAVIRLFPLLKGTFPNLIKWGGGIYLVFMIIVQCIILFIPERRLLGLNSMHWVYIGTFIEIVIFSFAISYKIKEAFRKVLELRTQVSRDLHDDIGASLSSLNIYAVLARESIKTNPEKTMEIIDKIAVQSRTVQDNMADIVWSMKSNNDQAVPLQTHIKNYGSELLQDKNIEVSYLIPPEADAVLQNVIARKNILLIIREAINNIAKYSKASHASIQIIITDKQLILKISDNGAGFNLNGKAGGNGLKHIRQRSYEIKGTVTIESSENKGTAITTTFPLNVLADNYK